MIFLIHLTISVKSKFIALLRTHIKRSPNKDSQADKLTIDCKTSSTKSTLFFLLNTKPGNIKSIVYNQKHSMMQDFSKLATGAKNK